jgi:hypothetical protein
MTDTGPAHGPRVEPVVERTGFRISWGAIVAGMLLATALHIVLALIGLAIGMEVWEPGDRVDHLGAGLGIWTVVSGIIALFVGGLTTGRLAGVLTRGDGAVHGAVLWSLSTILAVWLVASGVGTLVGGALGLVGRTATAVAGGVGQVSATAVGEVVGMDPAAVQREVEQALLETGDPALHPDTLGAEAQRIGERTTGPASTETIARDMVATVRDRGGQVDRQAIANVIASRTGMSRPEAERVAIRVENLAQGVSQQAGELMDTAGVYAERAAAEASAAISTAAWWALLTLALSLGAAVMGVVVTARD